MDAIVKRSFARMQQSDRKIASSMDRRKRRRSSANPFHHLCRISLFLSPLLIVGAIIMFLRMYNEMLHQQDMVFTEAERIEQAKVANRPNVRTKKQHEASSLTTPQHPVGELYKPEILLLTTKVGKIRIHLRPDLSKGSVDYIHRMMQEGCRRCNFYRVSR